MGVKDEFLGSSFVKVLVTLWCLLQRNDGGVDRLGDLHLVIEDCHHQLTMVTHHRTLTGGEREGLCPAQTNAYTKLTDLRVLVNAAWIASYIQARNTHSTSDLRDTHHGVEHCSWRLS